MTEAKDQAAARAGQAASGHVVGPGVWTLFLVLATATQIAFKWAGNELEKLEFGADWFAAAFRSPAVGCAIVGYLAMFIVWLNILQRAPLSRAFAMTGLVYLTVPSAAYFLFGERMGWLHVAGIVLIVLGIAVMGSPEGKPRRDSFKE